MSDLSLPSARGTGEYTLAGTEMDYSHVTQTGFFVTVKGTKQNTVIFAGDRWADFAWNGIGYNQWVPVTKTGARPQFHSVSQWPFNVTTGEWRVGPANNYILNPDIQADRVIVSSVRGWRNPGGSVTNVNGGVNGSRFALQVSNSGGVEQRIQSVPAGTYTLSLHARGSAGQVVITGANGSQRTPSDWIRPRQPDYPTSTTSMSVPPLADILCMLCRSLRPAERAGSRPVPWRTTADRVGNSTRRKYVTPSGEGHEQQASAPRHRGHDDVGHHGVRDLTHGARARPRDLRNRGHQADREQYRRQALGLGDGRHRLVQRPSGHRRQSDDVLAAR
ncbi:hypothetical protein [Streptomyces sp. NPDC088801]|uniref:hypothetical protein n=1 Tax=Streptomyces sp. NPDC088801 TaxID=3365903 RepID=UPI00381AA8B4